jgi:hypothetical protein
MKVDFTLPATPPVPETVTLTMTWQEMDSLHRIVSALSVTTCRAMGLSVPHMTSNLYDKLCEIRRDAQQPKVERIVGYLVPIDSQFLFDRTDYNKGFGEPGRPTVTVR